MHDLIVKSIAAALIAGVLGPMLAVFLTPMYVLFRKIYIVPFKRKKLLQKAIEQGHVVTAKYVRSHDIIDGKSDFNSMPTGKTSTWYTYEYNGKTYKYHAMSRWGSSDQLTLYFIKNPRKADVADELGLSETPWFRCYLLMATVCIIGVFVIGVIYIYGM